MLPRHSFPRPSPLQDTYTDVRKAFASAPSAWVDLRQQIVEMPRAMQSSAARLRSRVRTVCRFLRAPGAAIAAAAAEASGHVELTDIGGNSGLAPLQPPAPEALTLAAVIVTLGEPPLALQATVTFGDIASLLGVPVERVEAVCSSWHLLAVLLESRRRSERHGAEGGQSAAAAAAQAADWSGGSPGDTAALQLPLPRPDRMARDDAEGARHRSAIGERLENAGDASA